MFGSSLPSLWSLSNQSLLGSGSRHCYVITSSGIYNFWPIYLRTRRPGVRFSQGDNNANCTSFFRTLKRKDTDAKDVTYSVPSTERLLNAKHFSRLPPKSVAR